MMRPDKKQTDGIRILDLCKSFGPLTVLDHKSFFFPYGKITCLMGKSGCGKTTLLQILMGFIPADSGEILGVPENISAVFQEDRLAPEFSVLTNVLLPQTSRTKEEKEQQKTAALSVLDTLGLKGAENTKVRDLSGGMSRRAALARALLAKHELLILDEPLKGLDEGTRNQTIELLKNHGKTILMVTHDPEEAQLLGADVVNM